MNANAADRIIVALDVETEAEALNAVETLHGTVGCFKVGLQLFTAHGPAIVRAVTEAGGGLFLDLKFHDIPNTVEHAVKSACAIGVRMLTVHLCGGGPMLTAAVKGSGGSDVLILGVSVLTSMTPEVLASTGVQSGVEEQVVRLAQIGVDSGIRGIVASPKEIGALRARFGDALQIVTPGVRPTWAAANDQARILTPADAIRAGANYLVIGRPILANPNPREAAIRIAEEIAGVL